jgi:hypothetical protein
MNEQTENKIDELLNLLLSNITDAIDDISFCIKHKPYESGDSINDKFNELDDMIQKYHRLHAFYMLSYRG